MHLCTVATLCFFKITSPRNYYYCDQDDFPWVCGSKYVSKSNCCHRHLVLYISDVKKFPYLPKIYISAINSSLSSPYCSSTPHILTNKKTSRAAKAADDVQVVEIWKSGGLHRAFNMKVNHRSHEIPTKNQVLS